MRSTWKVYEKHGRLTKRGDLPDSVFAFPKQRKEPMTDASHVRNAIARFDQVEDISDDERDLAFANIERAAEHFGVALAETDWAQLGRRPAKAAATRKAKTAAQKTTRKAAPKKRSS